MYKGLLYAIGAYALWGILPIYWKALQAIPALEIIGHRTVWSLVFMVILLGLTQRWRWISDLAKHPGRVLLVFLAGCLLAVNWLIYVYAVNSGFVVETSLGYFINPLVSVVLGMVVFKERLRIGQWLAVITAASGVAYLTIGYGALPWIALSLALSFGLYGLLKKIIAMDALEGMSLETFLLLFPALGYLIYLEAQGTGAFLQADWSTFLLLILTGVATGIPLLLFAGAAQRIPLSMLGVLQYIAPTLQFLLGILLYNEPFTAVRMVGFSLIWTALIIYTIEGMMIRRRTMALQFSK